MRSILLAGLANGAFVPPSSASGYLQLPTMMNPTVIRFAIVSAIVVISTSIVAALHFRYVERRFLAMRPAASARPDGRGPHRDLAPVCLSGSEP